MKEGWAALTEDEEEEGASGEGEGRMTFRGGKLAHSTVVRIPDSLYASRLDGARGRRRGVGRGGSGGSGRAPFESPLL